MMRKSIWAALLAVVAAASATTAQASVAHRGNPYRSFNSGVNYGAQQWEHTHRGHCHGARMMRTAR
jgi:hypothetical protein